MASRHFDERYFDQSQVLNFSNLPSPWVVHIFKYIHFDAKSSLFAYKKRFILLITWASEVNHQWQAKTQVQRNVVKVDYFGQACRFCVWRFDVFTWGCPCSTGKNLLKTHLAVLSYCQQCLSQGKAFWEVG